MRALLAMPPLLAVVALLLAGCSEGPSTASSGVLAELQRVAPLAQGTPTLVFVYTDG